MYNSGEKHRLEAFYFLRGEGGDEHIPSRSHQQRFATVFLEDKTSSWKSARENVECTVKAPRILPIAVFRTRGFLTIGCCKGKLVKDKIWISIYIVREANSVYPRSIRNFNFYENPKILRSIVLLFSLCFFFFFLVFLFIRTQLSPIAVVTAITTIILLQKNVFLKSSISFPFNYISSIEQR